MTPPSDVQLPLEFEHLTAIGAEPERRRAFVAELIDELTGFGSNDPAMDVTNLPVNGFNPAYRDEGLDWPATAMTMVGRKRLHNFAASIETVIDEGIPGDIVETGVWRGGASMLARAMLALRADPTRRVIVADSFEGLPAPNTEKYPGDGPSKLHTFEELAVGLEQVQRHFQDYGLLDDRVVFVKGWFRDTMPTLNTDEVAVLRLDGDMYESTIDPLRHLYDRIPAGGFVIVDDYIHEACRQAVEDFLGERGEDPEFHLIDRVGAFFRKPTA